jgi:hypothetical protein
MVSQIECNNIDTVISAYEHYVASIYSLCISSNQDFMVWICATFVRLSNILYWSFLQRDSDGFDRNEVEIIAKHSTDNGWKSKFILLVLKHDQLMTTENIETCLAIGSIYRRDIMCHPH